MMQASRAAGRLLFRISALAAVVSLAGCLSYLDVGGPGSGASMSATEHLASIRSRNGLPGLSSDPLLEKAARQQAAYMASSGRMAHTTGWGRDFATRMKKNGVEGAAAENVARGRMDLDRLFGMWMASDGHRRNMLDPRFAHYGLAYAGDGDQRYWALVLGR